MTESEAIPVQPFRTRLYTPGDLLGAFDPDDVGSYAATHDFAVYRAWVVAGGTHAAHVHAMAQAIHDSSITDALDEFTEGRALVGVMGGHRMARSTDPTSPWWQVVMLARHLTRAGMTTISGGGPGAMEAAHAGARTADVDLADLAGLFRDLAAVPDFPRGIGGIVAEDGAVDDEAMARLHAWQVPAFALAAATADAPGESLGVPTWHYGHEPPTPLATHIAKYFHNSIREEGLLAIARAGVVFFPGAAGTLQEVFQDATQNFYGLHGIVSPMVFHGSDFWHANGAVDVLRSLFRDHDRADLTGQFHVTDDVADAVDFLATHPPIPHPG